MRVALGRNLSVVEIRNEVESIPLAFLMSRDTGHAGEEGKPVVAGHCLFIALGQIVWSCSLFIFHSVYAHGMVPATFR